MPATIIVCLIILAANVGLAQSQAEPHFWLRNHETPHEVIGDIPAPPGFERDGVAETTFAGWLRRLPLKDDGAYVRLHNGQMKLNQEVHFAVLDIDTGPEDLQQCADAVIRLRAEYLYSQGRYEDIHFKFTSGDDATWRRWIDGFRPVVGGGNVSWTQPEACDSSYACFREYLNTVFAYAGTYSLSNELVPAGDIANMESGDIFIEGGFPGHAVIVVDMACNSVTGDKVFLLAQSYMPAQDIHILKNPLDPELSPWYHQAFGDTLETPEWRFLPDQLKRF